MLIGCLVLAKANEQADICVVESNVFYGENETFQIDIEDQKNLFIPIEKSEERDGEDEEDKEDESSKEREKDHGSDWFEHSGAAAFYYLSAIRSDYFLDAHASKSQVPLYILFMNRKDFLC